MSRHANNFRAQLEEGLKAAGLRVEVRWATMAPDAEVLSPCRDYDWAVKLAVTNRGQVRYGWIMRGWKRQTGTLTFEPVWEKVQASLRLNRAPWWARLRYWLWRAGRSELLQGWLLDVRDAA